MQTQTKTVRRDWLLKQIDAGRMEAKTDFIIEHDGTGANDVFGGDWKPARIRRARFEEITNCYGNKQSVCADPDFIDGMMNFTESDFRSKSGHCSQGMSADGRKLYSLGIHSNAHFTLREKVQP